MARTDWKRKYKSLKKQTESKDCDSALKHHQRRYIHISLSWPRLLAFAGLLGSAFLAVVNFMLLISTWKGLGLGDLSEEHIKGFTQLLVLYPIIGECVFIALGLVCLVALIKGGFSRLKSLRGDGLIYGLIYGLIFGLIVGLIVGLTSEFD